MRKAMILLSVLLSIVMLRGQLIDYSIDYTIDLGTHYFYGLCGDNQGHLIVSGQRKVTLFEIEDDELIILDTHISDQYYTDQLVVIQDTLYIMNGLHGIDMFTIHDNQLQYLDSILFERFTDVYYQNRKFAIFGQQMIVCRRTLDNAQTPYSIIETYDISNPCSPILLARDYVGFQDDITGFFTVDEQLYALRRTSGITWRDSLSGEWLSYDTPEISTGSCFLSSICFEELILLNVYEISRNEYRNFCFHMENNSLSYCWDMSSPAAVYTSSMLEVAPEIRTCL